jgi:hypothetical protein
VVLVRQAILVACVASVGLTGCGLIRSTTGEGVAATALPYDASLERGEDRRDVTVTVRAGAATLADVRESARFPVTRYCLSSFGGSDADWARDPATGDWAFARRGQDMVLSARCTAR